jgi:hypothetical protein
MERIMRVSTIKMVVVLFSYTHLYSTRDSEAYDNEYTHPYINEKAVKEHLKVNTILKETVGLNDGIYTKFGDKANLGVGFAMVAKRKMSRSGDASDIFTIR